MTPPRTVVTHVSRILGVLALAVCFSGCAGFQHHTDLGDAVAQTPQPIVERGAFFGRGAGPLEGLATQLGVAHVTAHTIGTNPPSWVIHGDTSRVEATLRTLGYTTVHTDGSSSLGLWQRPEVGGTYLVVGAPTVAVGEGKIVIASLAYLMQVAATPTAQGYVSEGLSGRVLDQAQSVVTIAPEHLADSVVDVRDNSLGDPMLVVVAQHHDVAKTADVPESSQDIVWADGRLGYGGAIGLVYQESAMQNHAVNLAVRARVGAPLTDSGDPRFVVTGALAEHNIVAANLVWAPDELLTQEVLTDSELGFLQPN